MSKKSDREAKKAARRKTSAAAPKRRPPRRTRMLALEPRMLFDGALGIDLGAQATAALQGDGAAPAESTTPAAPQAQAGAPTAPAAPEKSAVEKTAERLGIAPEAPVRNEIVFVDSTIQGHEALIAGLSPTAKVVMLDPTRDALDQIADYMDGERNVDAIHVLSHGSAGNLILAGQTYSADRLTQEYATDLARIGHALSADGDILLYGCDVGKGSAGERFIDTLSAITGADIAASVDKTGAADLGGDWMLEVKTGQVETVSISLTHEWDFLLTAPPVNVGGATLDFDGANRTLVSGTAGAVGAVYKYADVSTINGVQIDAYVTITGITNATLVNIDNDAPASYVPPVGTNAANVFAPEISVTAANGKIDFAINFKDPNGNNLTLLNFYNNSLDIDGAGGFQEFVEYGGFKSVTTGNPTDLVISSSPGNDRLRFTGSSVYNGLIVNDVGRVQANFDAISTLQISMGATGNTGGLRQYGSLFSAVSFGSPVTITAPTSDLLTTADTTPILTGSVGAAPLGGGETFSVTVNGTTYTTANGLGISGSTWSLELPTALASGQYDVRAVRSAAGLDIADQTQLELTINDAPTLADTALTLTVGEDAPLPTGAVGSPVSAFTGGISDVNPSAAKGIAIVGTVETNGTWYYTTNGGTTWTAVNLIDGSVGANNALLLADNANTRLYFRPNTDFSGSAPGALTLRAWDTTSGTAGTKVDPGAGGGALAFSSASDVIDVTVTPAADAPVNTVPGAQGAPINTSLEFSVLNGNALSVADVDGNLSTARVTVTNGVVNVTLAGGATISAGANGTNTLTISGTQAAINATLEGLRYTPTAGYTGAATLTLLATDSSAQTDSDVVNITVAALANVPRIDLDAGSTNDTIADNLTSGGYAGSSGSVNLWTGDWVENDPEGAPQSAVAGDVRVTAGEIVLGDPGANNPAVQAIARGVDLSNHMSASLSFNYDRANLEAADTMVVEVSTNGGVTYTNLATYAGGTVVGLKTLSLAGYETDNTLIRFRLTTNFDATENVQIDNVVITAQPTGFTNTFTEGGAAVAIAQTDSAITDPNGGNLAGATIRIAGNYQGGADVLQYTTTAGITGVWDATTGTLTLTGNTTAANYSAAIEAIRFNNTSDAPSTAARTITVVVRDQATGAASNTARTTITVAGVNDAPVGVNDSATAIEAGGVANATPGLNPAGNVLANDTDVDPGDTKTVSAITGGTVGVAKAGAYGSIVLNANGSYTYTLDNSNAAVEALRSAASELYDTFTYTVRDTAGLTSTATLTITIQGANDTATIGTPSVAVVTEDVGVSGGNLSATGSIAISDVDEHGAIFSTIVVPVGSPLGALVLAADGTYTYTVSNAAVQSLGAGQTAIDTFMVTSADGTTQNVSFTINGANDSPVNAVPGAQAVNEDTALSISGVSVNDIEGNLSTTRLTVTNGAVTVSLAGGATISAGANGSSTLTLSGTQAQINAALASISYQGNLNFNGGDTLTVLSTDSNGATDSDAVAITVNPVNDGPVNTVPAAQSVNEDTALSIAGVSVNDVDGNLSTTRLTVTNGAVTVSLAGGATISAGANGSSTLTLSGTQAQINAALASISYQGNLNFNGGDTLTVLSTDSNGATDSDAVAITVSSVNDGPVNTVPAAQSVNEDTALSIAGVSVNDVDGNLSTTRLTVTNGAVTVSLAGGATISAGANGSSTLTLSGTQAQINAALASISYQGNLNFNGGDTLTVLSTDSNGATDSDAVAITVSSVNDGPVNTVPAAQSVNEDTALSIAGVSVNDVDGNLSTTRLTVTNGAVTVSLAGGATISAGANGSSTLTLSGTQAQINAALASISYQGNLNFNGGDTLTVLSTDSNGVTDSDAVSITVSSVNDGPVNTVPGAQTVNEDTALSIAGVSVNDVDGNLSTTQLTVTSGALNVSLAGGATISAGANGSSTLTLSGTQAQINAALASISYQGNLNFNGGDTLTVLSTDSNGATDSDAVAITVSSVNDGPVNTVPGAQTVNEDTALSISGVSVNDVDGNLATAQLTVTNGAVTVSLAGGATISAGANGSSTLTLSGTQAQINAALASLSYQGNLNFNGSDTLTVLSTDGNGVTDSDAVSITVSSVNDGPVNTVPGAQTVNEDTALSISGVSVNDVDSNLSTTQLTVTNGTLSVSLAGGATISAGANGSSTLTLSGTQAQINAALASISYQGSLNFNGSDTLTVLSTDGNGATDSDAVSITVSSVNDGPVNMVPGAQAVNEDTALSISGVSVNDVDGNLSTTQLTVTNGTLSVSLAGGATISAGANGSSTLTLSGTQAQINAALASISYQGSLNFNGSDTLTVLSTDANGATDSDAVSITVSSVNDGPVNTVPGAQTVNEDTALSISGVSVSDVDGNLSTTQLTVTSGALNVSLAGGATISAGANGSSTLTLSGTQAQINAALASLSYQGNLDFNGSDTLTVLSTDGNGATDSDAVSITVSSVNDGPVNTVPGAQTVNEDTALSISGVSVNDVDGNLSTTRLTVTNGAVTVSLAGGATISAGANGSSTLTLSGTQAQVNAALASISYQGSLDFDGSDTLTVLSTDANGATDSDAVAITVNPVNDGPVNTVPGAQTVNEDTALSISGVSVNDVDGNLSTTQLTVTSGTLNVSLAGGATISSGANGSSTLTLSGTQAQINAALASLSYQGNLNFNGSDTLTVLSTDGNGVTDSDAVSITVSSVNDGPVNTVPSAQTVNEDTALSISGVSVNDVDANLATTQLTVTSGTLNVSLAGGATISAGANGSSTLTLSGTQAQINAALASLSYQGNLNFDGSDTLTVLSTDANGATDSDAVSITVSSVNDGPVNTVPGAQTVNEDTALSISGVSVNDVDGNLVTTQLTVTNGALNVSLAGGATISAGANGSSTLTLSGTQAQINAALASLSYQGNLNFNGSDTLTVLSTDGNGVTDSDAVSITVSSVNDGPVNAVPGAQAVNEDTVLAISGVSVSDVDGNLSTTQLTVTNGALNVSLAGGATIGAGANGSSTLTLSGTQAQINAALASISYQGNADFNGSDTLTVLSTDANGATDSDAVSITVNSVNDGPVNTIPGARTVNEDAALAFTGGNTISVNDVDGNLSTTQLTVTSGAVTVSLAGGATVSAGANGSSTLTLSGTQAQINAALATVIYQGNANFNGSDTLTVLSTDGNGITDSDAIAITVSAVNDGPVNTVPATATVNEDAALTFTGASTISVNDVDGNLSTTQLTVTSGTVTVSLAGGATISSGANGSSTLTLSGTQAQINAALASLSYQGNLNFNGSETLTVLSTDSNGATDSDSVAITVASVNDGPMNTVPGAQTVNEDTALSISGVSVNDVDGNLTTTQLTVGNGAVTVSLAGGATISAGANGSSTLTLSGTQAQINAALASLSYQGNSNFNGPDTLTVLSTDANGATDSDTVAITVSSVNDGPVNVVPGAQTVNEDTSLSISGVSVNDVDGNLSTTQLTVASGAVTVSLAGGATISAGANGSSTLTLSGTQAQINAALASLSYQGNLNFNGSDTLTVLSTDGNGVTDSDAVSITVSSVNDGPVNTVPGAQTVNEDTSLSIGGVSVNDVDGNLSTTQLTVTSGAVTVSLAGGATISSGTNGSSTLTLSGTQAQINAALASLAYQGNLNFNGADILTVLSTDANGVTDSDAVSITVSSVNDGPVNAVPGAQTVNEDTSLSISGVSVNDVDGNLSSTQLTVTSGAVTVSLAGGATISAGANGSSSLTLSGTQAQINAALASLAYQGNLDFNGSDTLTVLSTDGNGATDSDAVSITVSSVNDGPVNTVPGAQSVNEDTSLSISGVSVNDVDGNLSTTQLTVTSGTVTVSLAGGATIGAGANSSSTLTLSGTQAQINAALASLSYQGNLNFNGSDTLTVVSTDGNGVTDSDAVSITVSSVNDGPLNTVPGAQAVNEDTALSISGVSVNDVDGNLSTTQLTVTSGTVTVSLAGGATISAGANGSSTLTLSGTQAQINAALASLSYQGNLNFNGADTLTVLSTDGNGVTDSDAVSITVSSINDGPVNTVPGAQSVSEDTSLSISGVSVNDVDGNLSTTQLTVASGTLNVSLAGGATISAGANGSSTLTLSGTQAQINAALASISYLGNADFNGSDTLTVLSTDANGATDSDAVSITVSSVNDGPVNTVPGAQTVNEDTSLSISGVSVNDVDGNLSTTQLAVTSGTVTVSLAGGATISAGANGSATLTLSGTQAQINAALASLAYQGNLDFNGSDTLTVLSTDGNGATDSDAVSITVSSVNDGPVNTVPGAQSVNEDTSLSISGVSVNDVDGNLSTTQLTVTSGTLNVSLAGGATISAGANGSSTLTLSGTQAQINAALASISYQGNLNFNGSDTLTVLSADGNGATDSDAVSITVSSVNDGPVNTVPGAQSVNEDTSLSIGGVSVNDVDGNLSTTQLTVTNGSLNVSLAGGATISSGANGSSTLTLSGTQAQINAALASISYQGNANFNGSDTLTVLSTDGNGATDSDAVAITVSSVNDGPVNTVPGAQMIDEDTATPIAGVSVNDVDGNLSATQLTVSNGTVTVSLAGGATISSGANGSSTLTLSGTQAQINAALASLSYQGNLSFNGSDTLTVLSTDSNGTTDSDAVSINVTPVNNAPVNTVPGAQTVNEDTVLSISGVSVSDVEGNLSTTQLTVTNGALNVSLAGGATISAGANGSSTLTLSGTQAQINAALASISYQGNANFNGSDTLTVLSTDGASEFDSDTVSITVNSVNDGPLNAVPGAQTVNEDSALSIGGVSVNDVDGNLSTTLLTVTNGALNVSLAGGATISAGANGSSTLTLSGTQAQINAALASLSYQGNLNFSGSDTLTVLSTDANGATDSDAVSITVSSVNDGPVNTVPGAQTVNEDTALSIGGISVNDVEGNLSTTQLAVTNGALNVSLAGGATISAGANGSSTLTLSGTQAQINAALASLSYQGNPDFNGSDTLTVLSTDANGATDSDAVSITVTSVNDGPVNTVAGAQTVNEDTALSIGGLSVNDVDGNLSTTQLTVSSGALNVSLAGGATISAGANGSSTLTLSGTQAQINAALASLSYQGNPDFNGSDTLTVLSTDANGATDSDAVSITVSAVNDGPVNTIPGAQAVNEDTALSISGVSVNDVDGNLSTTQLTVTSGTLNVSLAGGATISAGANGSSTLTLSGTQAQINAALASISYQGNANFNGSDTLTVLSSDANGVTDSDAVSITVSAVNDGPVNTVPGAQAVNEDTALSISGVSVNDVDGNLSTTQLTVTNGTLNVSLAGGATISSGANGSTTLTLSGTQAQINAALASISYQGNADFNGSDTLTVLSTDGNGATDSDAVSITVSSVNDGPVNTVPGAQTVNEDTALSISGVSVNDVDGNLSTTQLTVANGAINVSLVGGATISGGVNGSSTLTLSGTQAQINAALASISYQGNAEFNGSDTLTVLSTDANGATDSDAVAITVSSVNDGPVNTVPGAQTVNEDTALSVSGLSVNDVDGNLSTTQLTVTNGAVTVSLAGGATISAGANGSSTLTLSGTQAQINAALASLSYQGNPDFSGSDTLTVLSTDANGATDADAVSITVFSVNDGPVNTVPGAQTVNEDTALSVSGVSVNDVDGNLSTTRLTVTNGTLNVSLAGGATVSAGANGSSTLTLSGTLAQINAALASITYQGTADFNGSDTLTVLSTDANGAADSDAVAITVSSVNDGPMNAVPGAQTVNEDSTLSISGISVNDVDGNLSTTQLSVTNGTLNVSLAGGATISAGANGSSTLTLSGTQAQINAALASINYQGNADFSGSDTLSVLSTDASGATDSDAVAITVNAVNDGPVNTVPGAQTVNEDTALPIPGVSVNDVDGNLSTTQLTVTNGTLNVSLAGGATISAGANGSSALTLSGTQAQINAALASISYQGNADFNGSDTLTVLSTDGNGLTDADAVSITVGSVNDGPVNAVPGAQTVNEDTVLPIGGLSVNDIDGNLSTTQLTVTNGAINVSLAGGATISAGANGSATLTLSGTQAQINAALASLSYQASPDFNGADTLTVLSTDANGATDSDAMAITVSSVNDGPMNAVPGAQTVNEDTVLSISGVSVNDVDGNLSTTQLSVTNGALNVSLAGGATISAGANGSSTLTLSGTQAQINAALASISYQGNPSYNGPDTLTVLSTDGNGATDSDTVSITVTGVNDTPVNTVPGAQTVNEDTSLSISGVSVSDTDGNLSTTQLTVTNGSLNVSLAGGATISAGANGSSTLTLSGTQAQINAALASISYQGNPDFNGSDTLTVLSTDANGATDSDTVSITVSSVDDGPVNSVPGAQTVNEDTVLSISGLSVNDVDGNLSTTQLTVTNGTLNVSLVGGATITAGANGTSTLTLSGTQAQINAALASLSYQGDLDFSGSDTLTVLSTDANGATDSDAVSVTVSSVNDGPVNTVPGAQAVNEDTALSISGVSVNDVDGNLSTTQLTVTNGTLNVSLAGGATISAGANGSSSLTLSGTQAQINAALASISYQGTADFNGSDTLAVLSTDANGATDSDAVSITVSSVNDGPLNAVPGAQTVNEDTVLPIGGISVNDVDGNLSTTQLTVTNGAINVSLAGGATISGGANGSATLTLSGTQAQINAALASLSYQGNAEFSGADTLTVLSTDANGSTDSDAVAITVNAVNDGPVNTVPGAQTVNEDTSISIGGVSVNDVDGNLSTTQLTVTNGAINVSLAGGATISAGANGSSTLTLAGTQAQINAALASLSYQGSADFNGSDTLTVLSTDTNGATDSDSVSITVSSVNDGPVNTVPGAQTVNEDTVLPIGAVSVNDVDGNLATTRLTVASGTVTVSLAGGATISAGANGSATLTLSGTQAQINAALASLSYQGNADFNGSDTLTVLSSDANGATDSDAVAITVNAVNDGPVNTVPGAQAVNEDTALPIGGIGVNDADGNLSTTQLTVTNGVLNVSLAGGATISAGANGSSTLTLSGTQAQINAALASVSYQGNSNFNGSDTLTVLSTDGNGVTDADAVSITVSSVNDGPVNTVPGAQTVNEDSVLSIGGVSVNDVDGNLSSTRLTVASGTLNVSLAGGATISAGVNGSSTLTLSGTQAQINAALASISYQGNAEFNGSDTLTVLSTDANGATDSDAISITVTAVNDAPAVTSAATATFVENATGAVYTATRSEVDSGDTVTWTLSGADAALFAIDPVTGVVSLTSAQDFDTPGDANADGIYEITVRATDSGGLFDQRNVQLTLTNAVVVPPAPPTDDPPNPMAGQSAPPPQLPTAPASQPVLPDFAPRAPQLPDRPLGLPVDAATPASNLGGAGIPGATSPAARDIADLNALPPTSAGPAATFGLVRLSVLDAGSHLRQTGAILQHDAGGHHLFVYHGVPGMRLSADNPAVLRVPGDAFAHTDPAARVYLEARLANGAPLPGWLKFDGLRGVFSGTPPEGVDGTLEVEVVARDTDGREARTKFTLEIEELRAKAAAAGLALGLDVDKEEAEKVRQELARQAHKTHMAEQARAATAGVRPAKPGAASFSDQVNAAKIQRDPLLDRISPSGKDKAGTRR